MISANELRIGNWVSSSKTIGYNPAGFIQVSSISSRGINSWQDMGASGEGKFEDIEPIPLTPELLETCGFEKDRSGWNLPSSHFSLTDKFYPCWMDKMLWPQDLTEFNSKRLEYLHQLQNLYFSLTGEELVMSKT